MIDVLIPVLGRPQNAQPVFDSLMDTATVKVRAIFLTTPGDTLEWEACVKTRADVYEVNAKDHQYPCKMNAGYRLGHHPFLLLASDDIEFQPGWDDIALSVADKSRAGVIGLNDMANAQVKRGLFSTHPLVRRSYIEGWGGSLEGPGHLLSERYDHNFCERELCGLAMFRGLWAFALAAKVQHKHPAWGTAVMDQTYLKGNRRFARDRQLFYRRAPGWGCQGMLPIERQKACR